MWWCHSKPRIWMGLAAARLISGIAVLTMVLLRALRWCDEGATPSLAVWMGLAAAQLISGIATSTMVMLRALQ